MPFFIAPVNWKMALLDLKVDVDLWFDSILVPDIENTSSNPAQFDMWLFHFSSTVFNAVLLDHDNCAKKNFQQYKRPKHTEKLNWIINMQKEFK